MNKTLPNPYYLFSFQHIASKERISFYPQVITSNVRYDKFRFVEAQTTNLSATPPEVFFEYLGQYYYSIYENITSGSTDISLAYNKLESGRAWVIVGDDNTQECFFEPYISNDEDFAQVIYVSDQEEACIYPTPSITPSPTSTPIPPSPTPTNTNTPSITPTNTNTPSITPTNTSTPTNTPTPSSTPNITPNPSTLNALWWSQFSNPSFLNLGVGNTIVDVIDGINGSTLFKGGLPPSAEPLFQNNIYPSCETGFSGGTQADPSNNDIISTLNGDYAWSPDITFFTRVIFSGSVEEGFILTSDSGGGGTNIFYNNTTPPYRWFQFKFNPNNLQFDLPFWADPENSAGFLQIGLAYTANTWQNLAFRAYQDGATYRLELWLGGSIIAQTSTTYTAVAPTINPGVIQAGNFRGSIAESFWFDRKLNNTEMAQMFQHLTTRYC